MYDKKKHKKEVNQTIIYDTYVSMAPMKKVSTARKVIWEGRGARNVAGILSITLLYIAVAVGAQNLNWRNVEKKEWENRVKWEQELFLILFNRK